MAGQFYVGRRDKIDRYTTVRKYRDCHGGAVCVFVRNEVAFNERLGLAHDELEAVWLNIFLPKTKPIFVGTLYRPPDQHNFYNKLHDCCSNCDYYVASESILIGDFNTNVLGKIANCLFKGLNKYCNS